MQVPTMRCKLHNNIPHCNLCYDASIAAAQIAEGKRNRAFSQQGLPLLVPDHYPTVRLALEKGTQFTCFTGTEVLALLVQKYLTPLQCASRLRRVLSLLALLVQKYKYCYTSTNVQILCASRSERMLSLLASL
jgi:hypothetical protein